MIVRSTVLSQREDDEEHITAYGSRTLSAAKRKYPSL